MKIFKLKKEWDTICNLHITSVTKIGFVPTMGALHDGHISLIEKSLENNDITVVSIFVNPTQFNDKYDLENYPNTLIEDIQKLENLNVDYLFIPTYNQLYEDNYTFKISENNISKTLCGEHRPGHFDGVLTVVLKLLNIIKPTNAYFGEKDYQQYLLIKNMVKAIFLDINIIPCPIIREPDGLAMSSRNKLLSKEERNIASYFPKILQLDFSISKKTQMLEEKGFEVDYIVNNYSRQFAAVKLGNVRLIDNVKK